MVVGATARVRGVRLPFRRVRTLLSMLMLVALAACKRPAYDTSTPEAALDAAVAMVQQGQAKQLPALIEIEARDVTFEDGVTEASAIAEVKAKAGDMLARLLRVAQALRDRFPKDVDREVKAATRKSARSTRDFTVAILADPAAWLAAQRPRITATDLGVCALLSAAGRRCGQLQLVPVAFSTSLRVLAAPHAMTSSQAPVGPPAAEQARDSLAEHPHLDG